MKPQKISTEGLSIIEWLKLRQKGIGGSDVAAIMGKTRWKTPFDVYEEKIADEPIITPENSRMRAGRMIESVVAQWYNEEYGYNLIDEKAMYIHGEYPYLLVNVDRIIDNKGELGQGVLECKFGTSYARGTWEQEKAPEWVYWQVMHAIDVLDIKWGIAAGLIDGEFYCILIQRNDEAIEEKNRILSNFWLTHVEAKVPPDAQNTTDLDKIYPETVQGKQVTLDQEYFQKYRQLLEAQDEIKKWSSLADTMKFEIQKLMSDAEELLFKEQLIATYKYNKSSLKFSKEKFELKYPELFKQFCLPQPGSRIFRITNKGKELAQIK